jgi:NADH:ubiquinone oxidoreductase subunit 5 (subunit L)/multisubunit Na+/H+ antiporter MnhA subunit
MFMLLGLFSIYIVFESFDYSIIFAIAPLVKNLTITIGFYNASLLDMICLFLFLGAMGKSAQFGFHNWLPDAMEGPTPVSALIHAATMVTAGIFLLIRCSFLFEMSPSVLQLVAIVGSITALFGAYTGLFSHDIKKVIAFSTCSQLGYMMLACGLERYNAAFFHLVSHAFFKALLFLAAGAIIHAAFDEQDVRKYGSLKRYLPLTYICFLIGSLNLMGIPFLSGFYTKDLILELAFTGITPASIFCYGVGVHSVIITSAYSTRILILTFMSEPNNNR